MARRTDFRAANTYSGQKIKGKATISYKIDGVRILQRDGKFVTRNDKVPPGLEQALTEAAKAKLLFFGDCEVFKGSFFSSNGPLQQHSPATGIIDGFDVYPLVDLDPRLFIEEVEVVDKDRIAKQLEEAVALGYEGLVIRTATHWYRVKPQATADVFITGWFEQLDKNKVPKGQLGGFDTNWGKITAFTDAKRKELWDNPKQYVGDLIEVQYKERYHTGKFRYAVKFLDFRTDKDTESFDTPPPEEG